MADNHKLEAAKSGQEFVKYLVVLAVGALGFGLSRLSTMSHDFIFARWVILASAAALGISVLFGILAHGTLVSQIYADTIDLEAAPLPAQARIQWVLFFVGMVALGVAVFISEFVISSIGQTSTYDVNFPF